MAQQPNTASQEYLLLDYAQRLERHRDGRRGVHVHLSRLKPQNRREHHIRIAMNTLDDFVQTFEGQSFLLGNGDLIFVVKGASLQQMDDAVMRMRYLFSEDPLTQADSDGEGHGRFATLYNIEGQYAKFMELCERVFEEERARQKRLQQMAEQTGETFEDARRPLKPEQLGRLEEFLERAALSSVFRRQAVSVVHKDAPPKPIFNELFISIFDLAKTVLPDVNLSSNRWLFQHLTQTLDRRVLKMLARADDSSLHSSFSINVNVGTLLAPEFLEFDSSLRMGSRGTLVVELQLLDILSDYSAFVFARDFVREKGYRICLDGITPDLIRFIDRQYMEVDLVKLSSDSVFDSGGNPDIRAAIAQQVERVGKGRVILSRCDNEAMIRTGQSMGITMFQGRYLDAVLQQIARTRNPPSPRAVRR
ncbi:MAG: hypothetical protein CMM40_14265 [Rhodospirillaceae bacterium]|nr:hypothetical protein [Rhodospirillaceae bacterium]